METRVGQFKLKPSALLSIVHVFLYVFLGTFIHECRLGDSKQRHHGCFWILWWFILTNFSGGGCLDLFHRIQRFIIFRWHAKNGGCRTKKAILRMRAPKQGLFRTRKRGRRRHRSTSAFRIGKQQQQRSNRGKEENPAKSRHYVLVCLDDGDDRIKIMARVLQRTRALLNERKQN